MQNKYKIGIIGLGYVGLPLAVEFSKKYNVIGFDIKSNRIDNLNSFIDETLEVTSNELELAVSENSDGNGLYLTTEVKHLASCNIYIITVPTPIDKFNNPDLNPLFTATKMVGKLLKKNDIVIYESTVYPGVTEDECAPILEKTSNLRFNVDFYIGYSPERINPGDKLHTLTKILKITSGSNKKSAIIIDNLYKSIIKAGTFMASSIKVAEAAKVIENTQRDINIAFVNELSKIFRLLNIDTTEVLEAASTKWNFLNFKPGLVGGHCIGVDPYYLSQKAQELGYHPEIILAGRRINDSMGKYIASEVIKLMIKKEIKVKTSKILILGFTFKENCPDVRNTKIIDIYDELINYGTEISIFDPLANHAEVKKEYNITLSNLDVLQDLTLFSCIIIAVAHDSFKKIEFKKSLTNVIFDVKSYLDINLIDSRL
jgi:UDP-N-acetyl-D-galactosamine dehydrogenase